jgi:hypothetical protein
MTYRARRVYGIRKTCGCPSKSAGQAALSRFEYRAPRTSFKFLLACAGSLPFRHWTGRIAWHQSHSLGSVWGQSECVGALDPQINELAELADGVSKDYRLHGARK